MFFRKQWNVSHKKNFTWSSRFVQNSSILKHFLIAHFRLPGSLFAGLLLGTLAVSSGLLSDSMSGVTLLESLFSLEDGLLFDSWSPSREEASSGATNSSIASCSAVMFVVEASTVTHTWTRALRHSCLHLPLALPLLSVKCQVLSKIRYCQTMHIRNIYNQIRLCVSIKCSNCYCVKIGAFEKVFHFAF